MEESRSLTHIRKKRGWVRDDNPGGKQRGAKHWRQNAADCSFDSKPI
jgi:hypothetical protein